MAATTCATRTWPSCWRSTTPRSARSWACRRPRRLRLWRRRRAEARSGAGEGALEKDGAVGAAELGLEGAVGVGHEAQDIAASVHDARDVARRAVGVLQVAEDHLALAFDAVQRLV